MARPATSADTREAHMRSRRTVLSTLAAVAVAGVTGVSVVAGAGFAQPSAPPATVSCPWVGSSAPISQRVSQVLAAMSTTQKVDLLTGASGSSYVGLIPAI